MLVRLILPAAMSALLICGCGDKTNAPALRVGGTKEDPVMYVKNEDAVMNEAIAKAKATVSDFVKALAAPKRNQSDFAVKKPYPTRSGGHEHIWINNLKFDGKKFSGTVNNDPEDVSNLKFGDKAIVGLNEISDWMYMEGDAIAGGYTIRALKETIKTGPESEQLRKMKFKD